MFNNIPQNSWGFEMSWSDWANWIGEWLWVTFLSIQFLRIYKRHEFSNFPISMQIAQGWATSSSSRPYIPNVMYSTGRMNYQIQGKVFNVHDQYLKKVKINGSLIIITTMNFIRVLKVIETAAVEWSLSQVFRNLAVTPTLKFSADHAGERQSNWNSV